MSVLIVIPVLDEAHTVGRVVEAARVYGPVLVVDDGSQDGSGAVATAAGAEVLRHPRPLGKAQALLEAERVATLQFEKVVRRYRARGWQQTIGSSGTARMLAKVLKANGLNDYDQGGITYGGLLRLSLRLLEVGHVKQLKNEP